jgi:hypothetical protein
MDFALDELQSNLRGVSRPPDTDVRAYLTNVIQPDSAP